MSTEEQRNDGSWGPACPEPFWFGWRLRNARCECGEEFRGKRARVNYREHWYSAIEGASGLRHGSGPAVNVDTAKPVTAEVDSPLRLGGRDGF